MKLQQKKSVFIRLLSHDRVAWWCRLKAFKEHSFKCMQWWLAAKLTERHNVTFTMHFMKLYTHDWHEFSATDSILISFLRTLRGYRCFFSCLFDCDYKFSKLLFSHISRECRRLCIIIIFLSLWNFLIVA